MWRLFAPSPKAVEYCRYFMSIECNPVWLVSLRRAFDSTRKLRQFFDEREFRFVGQ
jgi:hypothetical protein